MKPISKMTQGELGAFVQSQLRKNGIEVILAGGAAVAIYSNNKYVSKDLDLINVYGANRRKIRDAGNRIFMKKEGILDTLTRNFLWNFLQDLLR